jgi:hypothetical protein
MGMQANVFSPDVVVLKLWWYNPFLGLCPNFIFKNKILPHIVFVSTVLKIIPKRLNVGTRHDFLPPTKSYSIHTKGTKFLLLFPCRVFFLYLFIN